MTVEIDRSAKTAVLIGATGLVGSYCLKYLIQHKAYNQIITIARKSMIPKNPKHRHIQVNFEQLEKIYAQFNGDDLYICLGTTIRDAGSKKKFIKVDFTYNLTFAKMASQKGFNQILLVSSVGANADSLFFYNKIKGYLEDEIKKLPFWATHLFQPSVLLGKRPTQRFGEQAAGKIGNVLDRISGGLLTKYKPVEAEVVAKAMIHAAQQLNPGLHIYPSHALQKLSDAYYRSKDLRK